MWLSKMNEMSVGPLWVLRSQAAQPLPSAQLCPRCGGPWLLSVPAETTLLVVLASDMNDQQHQLLHNCLHAAGWRDAAALFSLHQSCADNTGAGLQALNVELNTAPVASIVVFGTDTARQIDPSFSRGQIHSYQNARLIVTHHPEQMLATPSLKAEVWSDLCLLLSDA